MAYLVDNLAIMNVTFEGLLFQQQVMTSFHYQLTGATAPLDGGTLIGEMITKINTATTGLYDNWRNCIAADVVNVRQYFQWITPTRYAYTENVPAVAHGAMEEDCLTPNLAYVVTRRGELATRSNISNLHLPGVVNVGGNGGYVSDPLLSLLTEFGFAACQQLSMSSGATMLPVAFHRANSAISAVMTRAYPQLTLREMRRRTVGLGS